jgi:hypothetical protein
MKNTGKVVEDLNNEELAKSIIIRLSAAFSDLRPYKKNHKILSVIFLLQCFINGFAPETFYKRNRHRRNIFN